LARVALSGVETLAGSRLIIMSPAGESRLPGKFLPFVGMMGGRG
jgi:hypothetical protein